MDQYIFDVLTLQIKAHSYKIRIGYLHLLLVQHAYIYRSNGVTTRCIKQNDVSLLANLELENATIAKLIEIQDLISIVQYNDGRVNITFARHSTNSKTESNHDYDGGNSSRAFNFLF